MRETISHLAPAALCFALSVIALARWAGSETGVLSPAFLAFLPACFLIMGFVTLRLQHEVSALRQRLQDLEGKRS